MSEPATPLFASIDRAAFAAAFGERLRAAGLAAPLSATQRFTAALATMESLDRVDLYWLARISFVTRHEHLPAFDAVFAAVFDDSDLPSPRRSPHATPTAPASDDRLSAVHRSSAARDEIGTGLPWATLPSVIGPADAGADGALLPELLASSLPGLADRPFDQLDEDELRIVGAKLETALTRWPVRRSRRYHFGRRGRSIAYRPTLRRARRTGGEPFDLVRLRRQPRPRPVIAFIDVSGSMEPFARGYLHVMRALATTGRVEVFAFATRLTRITAPLRHHSAAHAIDRASDAVGDRFGGTRLASSLRELQSNVVWSAHVRGGVVLIVSDGADTDPPAELRARMARLRRLAHRIVWVNPRLAAADYRPLVGGMAAALPFCDDVLPGDSLAAMDDVLRAITR